MMSIEQLLRDRLATLNPTSFSLRDDSHLHTGHAGSQQGGHFHLTLASEQFIGQKRLAQHQLVMGLVSPLIPSPIHALSLTTSLPKSL